MNIRAINYIYHLFFSQDVNRNAKEKNKDSLRFKKLLDELMATEYQKVNETDYGDCGYPLVHYERDLYLTFDKILHDEEMVRLSQMSSGEYVSAVNDYYYNIVVKDFEETYCY